MRFCWLLLFSTAALAGELRGVWLDRSSLVSREEIRTTLRKLAEANFNAVFVNTWSRGYPLWRSKVFEQETGLAGDPGLGGRDVLGETIEEAAPLGLAVIPWIEYGFIGGYSGYFAGDGGQGPIFDRHPDWLARKRGGDSSFTAPGGFFYWMAHARPDVQEFLLALMSELAAQYDVPAIQFDRARYPELDCGYDDYTRQLYAQEHDGQMPPQEPGDPEWLRWRTENLNRFVKLLYARIKAADWRVLVTNAPGLHRSAYVHYAQDYPAWLAAGALDFVSPQIYRRDAASYRQALETQLEAAGDGSRLVPGLDITNSNPDELVRMIEITRQKQLPGVVIWYYRALLAARALERLHGTVFADPAPPPWRPASAGSTKSPQKGVRAPRVFNLLVLTPVYDKSERIFNRYLH